MLKKIILALSLASPAYADCRKMKRDESGGILVFEEGSNAVKIYSGERRRTLDRFDVKWQWNVPSKYSAFRKTKNDAKPVMYKGRLHLLLVSSRGDAVGLIDFDSKRMSFFRRLPGSIHSAAVTPKGLVVANSRGFATIVSTEGSYQQSCRHVGAHASVYDKALDAVWVYGGSLLRAYDVGGTPKRPSLNCNPIVEKRILGGGHDLQFGQDRLLIGAAGRDLFWFDPYDTRWGFILDAKQGTGLKSVSENNKTGEVIYIRNDRSNGFKHRSNIIRSVDGFTREIKGRAAVYKARWFQSNCSSF